MLTQSVDRAATWLVAAAASRINGVYSATLTRADNGAPVAGQSIVFSVRRILGHTDLCQAVTDATGVASCRIKVLPTTAPFATSYQASYAGSGNFEASRATGEIP
jgi:hypothetical protein